MKKRMSQRRHAAHRMIVIPAMLIGISGLPATTVAQCVSENDNILRVDAGTLADPQDQDGLSWDCAFSTLQAALDNIDVENGLDTIWIAEGTYVPSDQFSVGAGDTAARKVTFLIPTGISVLGGFPAGGGNGTINARDPSTYITTLTGEIGSPGLTDNAYHVVVILATSTIELTSTLIDGVTITAGYADGTGYNTGGGGVHVFDIEEGYSATPTFQRCTFINNYAENTGGALLLRKSGAFLRECEFRDNTTGGSGFDEYEGGGAVAANGPLNVIKCMFVMNTSDDLSGGAIRNVANTSTKLVNCEFYGNSAPFGGAVSTNSGVAVSSVFAGNFATDGSGGALYGGSAHGCTFADNKAIDGLGGGALRA